LQVVTGVPSYTLAPAEEAGETAETVIGDFEQRVAAVKVLCNFECCECCFLILFSTEFAAD
jgi:hypothetical protein